MNGVFQGSSKQADTTIAVNEALEGCPQGASWALVFSGGHHSGGVVLEAVHALLGPIPIYGGSTVGTIGSSEASYSHFEIQITLFPAALLPVASATASLRAGEREAGRQVARTLDVHVGSDACVLAFYDSIKLTPPPQLYAGAAVLNGFYEVMGDRPFTLSGGGMVGDLQMANSYVFTGSAVEQHCINAIVLPQSVRGHTTVMHGCTPISMPMQITKVERNLIFEIDGRPALDVVNEITHTGTSQEDLKKICLGVSIGMNYGDRWAAYDESNYVNRLLIAADPESKALVIFDDDFEEGSTIEIMSRDNVAMVESARAGGREASLYGNQEEVVFSLYINCAGRTRAWCGHHEEEADVLRQAFETKAPLAGCYCGVEFTPVLGRSRAVDWNGVLTQFILT